MRNLKMGQEYVPELEDAPAEVAELLSGTTFVPIEYGDTGNLIVDQYPKNGDEHDTLPWSADTFEELVTKGFLVEASDRDDQGYGNF